MYADDLALVSDSAEDLQDITSNYACLWCYQQFWSLVNLQFPEIGLHRSGC